MIDIENVDIIEYILKNNATTRETAKQFGVSRQTISNRIAKTKNLQVQEMMKNHFKFKSKKFYLKNI